MPRNKHRQKGFRTYYEAFQIQFIFNGNDHSDPVFLPGQRLCIQLFAKSHLLSTQTVNQNHAVTQAQNLAESYLALEGDINAMQDLFSPSEQISENTLRLTFDTCWNLCSAENGGSYQAELVHTPAEGTGIMEARSPCMTCLHRRCLFIQFLSCITLQRGGGTMSNSSKKKQFGMNIGSASILLVFVILCLVSFAVLSIVSANADSRLSTRVWNVLLPTMMPAIRQSSLWPVWTIRCVASTKPPTARMRITAP